MSGGKDDEISWAFPTCAACFDFQDEGDQSASTTKLDITDGRREREVFRSALCLVYDEVSPSHKTG